MSTRSTRRPQAQTALSPLETLLLAQATWELGSGPNSWQAIAKLLSKHPLLSRPKSFFNAQFCHSMYEDLMKEADLEISEANEIPHAPMNLKLAERHFKSRHAELRELILSEEFKFQAVMKEIEDIRAGLWDQKIEAKLTGKPLEPEDPTETQHGEAKIEIAPPSDEIFDGSELSGVTESAESTSSPPGLKDELAPISSEEVPTQSEDIELLPPVPERSLTPQVHMKSPSPSLPVDIPRDMTTDLPGDAVQDEEIISDTKDKSESPVPGTPKISRDKSTSPMAVDTVIDSPKEVEQQMKEDSPDIQAPPSNEEETLSLPDQHTDQRQEEEEEEINQDDEGKEEEEEASQGQQDEIQVDPDNERNSKAGSPKLSEPDATRRSERACTPPNEAATSEADHLANEGHSSGSEEPAVPARRSSRRRKSSVASIAPLPARKKLRSQARVSESEPRTTVDSENEEQEIRDEETPQPEDENSSPFDSAMTRRRDGKRKASFLDSVDSPLDKKRLREDSEPDDDEPGPSSHNTRGGRITRQGIRTEEQVALKRFQNVIGMLHSQISQHRNGTIFHNPIKNSEAPDYHEIVKRPMDLKTIKTRVKDGLIANSLEFQRDIFLMFANSMMYNRPGSDVYTMAEDMMLESEGQIIAFRQTEGLVKRGQRP